MFPKHALKKSEGDNFNVIFQICLNLHHFTLIQKRILWEDPHIPCLWFCPPCHGLSLLHSTGTLIKKLVNITKTHWTHCTDYLNGIRFPLLSYIIVALISISYLFIKLKWHLWVHWEFQYHSSYSVQMGKINKCSGFI